MISVLTFAGCKKDKGTDSLLIFDGEISFSIPEYVVPGYTQSFYVPDISTVHADGGPEPGYYFNDTTKDKKDTTLSYTLVVPDSLGTFSFTCAAFADGYYNTVCTKKYTVVVDTPGRSLSGFGLENSAGSFEYGGHRVYYAAIAGRLWTIMNLPPSDGKGRSYGGEELLSNIYGGYFTWDEAVTACPEGWRLPDEDEWNALAREFGADIEPHGDASGVAGKLMGDVKFNWKPIWADGTIDITGESGLSLPGTGYAVIHAASVDFRELGEYGAFWTASEDSGMGVYKYIYRKNDILYSGTADKASFAASVRCVRDIE